MSADASERKGDGGLWAVMLLPPTVFLLSLSIAYGQLPFVCDAGTPRVVHFTPVTILVVDLLIGLMAFRAWRLHGKEPPTDTYGPTHSRAFMAVLGMASSALFALLLIAQWLAMFFIPYCRK